MLRDRGNTLLSFPGPNSISFYSFDNFSLLQSSYFLKFHHSSTYFFISHSQLSFIHKVESGPSSEMIGSNYFVTVLREVEMNEQIYPLSHISGWSLVSEITDSGYGSEIWDQNSTATNGRDHKQESVIKPHKCYFSWASYSPCIVL